MGVAIIICLIVWIICGFLSLDLQVKKGYDGGFWIGFLLGIIGLIYSAGLPDVNKKKIKKQAKEIIIESEEDGKDFESYTICKNCGFQIFDDEKKCSNCGNPKK